MAIEDIMINRNTKFELLPKFLTPAEVSQYLGLGRTTVYMLIESGELVSRRFGRRRFVLKEALRPQPPVVA